MNELDQARDEYNRLKINRDAIHKQLQFARDEMGQMRVAHDRALTRTYHDGLITGFVVSFLVIVGIIAMVMAFTL
jgi:hypothetical protein